jgi:hypothetical protein
MARAERKPRTLWSSSSIEKIRGVSIVVLNSISSNPRILKETEKCMA